MDNNYIYVNIYKPICSKCKCEINELNLSLAYWCKCDNEKEKIWNKSFIPSKNKHLSEIYKRIEYIKHPLQRLNEIIEKKISIFTKRIKAFLKGIIMCNMKSNLNLFNFSKKQYIEENEQGIPFFNEEYSEKLVDLVNNLNSSKLEPNILEELKTFILDIHYFVLILKKNPLISQKIIFQNVYTKYSDNLILYDYNIEFQDLLKQYFFKEDCNYHSYNEELIQIFPIIEKNIILLIYTNLIKMYNFIFNNFVLTVKAKIGGTKICKINPENLVILGDSKLYFSKMEYDSMNNPIKLYYFDCIKLPCAIIDFDIVNENNIICIDIMDKIHLLNIFYHKNNIIYNISRTETINYNYYNNYILADKINKQIVLSSEKITEHQYISVIKFYDIDLTQKKKEFKFKDNTSYICSFNLIKGRKLKYLNSNLYILFFYQKIYLISSKYLEIVSKYVINIRKSMQEINFLYYNYIILEKSKNIIVHDKYSKFIFKLFNNEIIFDEKSNWLDDVYSKEFFNIIEINEQGDFIIIIFTSDKKLKLCYINNKKVENIFIEKRREELYGKKESNDTNDIYDESESYIYSNYNDFDERCSNDDFHYGIGCPTCSYGWPICSENDSTINTQIRKYKEVKNDYYEKKMKKKLRLKKDRNKIRKKIKKHYITSERKYKNDLEKDCHNKKFKKYVKKYIIKAAKKYKNDEEKY